MAGLVGGRFLINFLFSSRNNRSHNAAERKINAMITNITCQPVPGTDQAGEPEFLNKNGVAAMLSISRRSVDSMLARGELPHIRLSKRCIRFPRKAVLEALAARTICNR